MRIVALIAAGVFVFGAQAASAQGLPLPSPIPPKKISPPLMNYSLSFTYWPKGSSDARPKTLRVNLFSGQAQVITGGGGGITASRQVNLPPGTLRRIRSLAKDYLGSKPEIVPPSLSLEVQSSPRWSLVIYARGKKTVVRSGDRKDSDRLGSLLMKVAAKVDRARPVKPRPPICRLPHRPHLPKLPGRPGFPKFPGLPFFPRIPGMPYMPHMPWINSKVHDFLDRYKKWQHPHIHFPHVWKHVMKRGLGQRIGLAAAKAIAKGGAKKESAKNDAKGQKAKQAKQAPKTVDSRGIMGGLQAR